MRFDDDVAESLSEHRLDGRLQFGRRLHDIRHHRSDSGGLAQALTLAAILHDRANALLKALIAILDLIEGTQARSTAMGFLAQRFELHLPARHLRAQARQPRLLVFLAGAQLRPAFVDRR